MGLASTASVGVQVTVDITKITCRQFLIGNLIPTNSMSLWFSGLLLARGSGLEASMSRYLVDRIAGLANVGVLTRTNVTGLEGYDGKLEAIRWRRGPSGEEVRRPIRHLFLFIGAEPNTDWLAKSGVALDAKGFVLTGGNAGDGRQPLETSRRGIFAIGDVRSGSVKRVATAVGEGAQVVAALHAALSASKPAATAVALR
jgi:thioredoxin reductase (NADPH)